MLRIVLSYQAFLVFSAFFTVQASTLEAQSIRSRSGLPKVPEILGLKEEKKSCCGMSPVRAGISRFAEEYDTYRLTATYYSLREGLVSTLMFNNKGPQPILATPTFYSLSGTKLQLAPIVVPAASYLEVDMRQLLAGAADEFSEGSLKVDYQGVDKQLGVQVRLADPVNKLLWAEQLIYAANLASSRLESVWHLPFDGSAVKLIVSNTSYSPVTVTLDSDGTYPAQANPVQITLSRSETRVLDIGSDLVGRPHAILEETGGVSIEHSGNPGAVVARMLVGKANRGYSASIPFVDPENTVSQKWHGNGLRIRNIDGSRLRPVLVARNTGSTVARIRGRIPYTLANGEVVRVTIPRTVIAAGDSRRISLQGIGVPPDIDYAGIELEYDTPKGSVVTAVQSVSQNGDHVFQVPIFDPEKLPSSAGGFPWKADGDYSTVVYIKNETDSPKRYNASLILEDGSGYSLPVTELKAGQTVAIDFRKLRDSQTPDSQGNVIPIDAVKGQIAWSSHGPENKVLSGRSEQISVQNGVASTYACANCCPNEYYASWMTPYDVVTELGTVTYFAPIQQDQNCMGQPFPPYPASLPSWDSTNWSVASVWNGSATSVGTGYANIQSFWDADDWWYESERCDYIPVPVLEEAPMEVVPPTVQSISATLASTKNPTVTPTPAPGVFTTQNSATAFPTETSTDVMVVFQNSTDTIGISAQGVNPPSAASSLKWKIERNPTDAVASGLPTLSSTTGAQISLTPTTAGSFRLISFFDANESGSYDAGEEAKVLLLAILRASMTANDCTIDSPMLSFTGGPHEEFPGMFGVFSGPAPLAITCVFTVEGGGSNKRIGTGRVHFGNVGNLTEDTARVNYSPSGTATENPGAALPMVDTGNVSVGNSPTGGATAFRLGSSETSSSPGSGGKEWVVTSSDAPNFGPVKINHENNNNLWSSTQGGYNFTEFIVGYSETFPKTYVAVAKATWTIRFVGTRKTDGTWDNTGSAMTLQGGSQSSANFTVTITNNSPQTGNAAGLQVLGLSYVNQHAFTYSQ